LNKEKVILIEDDPDIAWIVQLQLKQAGYHVHAAMDGISGLAQFMEMGADLLLLDIDLPGLNGWEVYSRVRAVSQVPIIMLTAYSQERQTQPMGFGRGSDRCIEKPFSIAELKAHIEDALDSGYPQEAVLQA
jgi:DNA-binding response OmpR family regulator